MLATAEWLTYQTVRVGRARLGSIVVGNLLLLKDLRRFSRIYARINFLTMMLFAVSARKIAAELYEICPVLEFYRFLNR